MLLGKRDQTRMERQLSSCLTQACEAGKAEIVGFSWLTHEVDYARFPESLQGHLGIRHGGAARYGDWSRSGRTYAGAHPGGAR